MHVERKVLVFRDNINMKVSNDQIDQMKRLDAIIMDAKIRGISYHKKHICHMDPMISRQLTDNFSINS